MGGLDYERRSCLSVTVKCIRYSSNAISVFSAKQAGQWAHGYICFYFPTPLIGRQGGRVQYFQNVACGRHSSMAPTPALAEGKREEQSCQMRCIKCRRGSRRKGNTRTAAGEAAGNHYSALSLRFFYSSRKRILRSLCDKGK